ncbi:hypothetical protein JYA59_20935, partial [Vibrio neptunius]|uniref:hypothetical protein n=1 Tax=Vibrio neptunius TaxID=170651 RepID=UPI0019D0C45E
MEHFVSGMDFFLRDFGTGYALWNTSFREWTSSFGILERATPYGTLRFGNELRPSGFWNGLRPMEHFVSGTDFF